VPTIASAVNTAVTVRPNATGQPLFRRSGNRRIMPLFIKCETEFNTPFHPSHLAWRLIDKTRQ
jgi:hypothetical protein